MTWQWMPISSAGFWNSLTGSLTGSSQSLKKELESQLTLIKTTVEFKTAELVANHDTLTIDVRHYIAFQFIIGSLAKANDASPADVSHLCKDAYT